MKHLLLAAVAAVSLVLPVHAQDPATAPSPGEIVDAARADEWTAIAPSDLLVMDLAPDSKGTPRRVIIQLMPAPFGQGWIGNIRKLATAHWWDGTAITRVQDNYVVQWGDPDGEDAAKAKALPDGLATMPESEYERPYTPAMFSEIWAHGAPSDAIKPIYPSPPASSPVTSYVDPYASGYAFVGGFPLAMSIKFDQKGGSLVRRPETVWPIHCYGMVGVGRNLSPDTGTGAELYTVIGQAPRHLDRNIALVGRVISGIEQLSSLPRGTGPLGFYEDPAQRVPIASIRLASELPAADRPRFEYLSTDSDSFARYADARANRRDPFFIRPAGGADICNIPVPVRAMTK